MGFPNWYGYDDSFRDPGGVMTYEESGDLYIGVTRGSRGFYIFDGNFSSDIVVLGNYKAYNTIRKGEYSNLLYMNI